MQKMTRSIQRRLTQLLLIISLLAVILTALCSILPMLNVRRKALDTATKDATERLDEFVKNNAMVTDSMLLLAQRQTLLVAEGAKSVIENRERLLKGYEEVRGKEDELLPNIIRKDSEKLGGYSVHIRVPMELLKNVEYDEIGTVINAELNREAQLKSGLTVNEELFLASRLSNEFAQIEHFRNKNGGFSGFSASYFCFDDSGIDVLGDSNTAGMIEYDARARSWYTNAVEGYMNNTLTDSGVFWSEPIRDGSGRGISMICSAPVVVDGKIAGVAGSGGLLVDFSDFVESSVLGETGFSFIVSRSSSKIIINPVAHISSSQSEIMDETDLSKSVNKALSVLSDRIKNESFGKSERIFIDDNEYYLAFASLANNDWTVMTLLRTDDPLITANYNELNRQIISAFLLFLILLLVLIVTITLVSKRFAKSFSNPIVSLKEGVRIMGEGNLKHVLNINTRDEIEELGNAFNTMARNLDIYIQNLSKVTAEKERIGAELDIATNIQASMLPSVFPAFPERDEFDIFATMTPAKEVGGDFYDFFMVDDSHLAIVVADVSGKGVPASLFMVIGKTLIKDHTTPDCNLSEVFAKVNNLLCDSNSEELFITAFEAVLDLSTGEMKFVNAGHEPPFICRSGESYKPHSIKPCFVLAGMKNMKYTTGSITLNVGDRIFLYTDGVPEATDINNQLYGMERLENVLNKNLNCMPTELLPQIKSDIDAFVGEAPQFDDITMLCLTYDKRYEGDR